MNKFVVALATVLSLGLAIPAFAEDAKMPMEKMGKPHMMGKAPHDGRSSPLSSPLSSHGALKSLHGRERLPTFHVLP